ncbi:MAG: hypothetical protein MUE73_02000 [Planctomycetes bacterium]|jgi:hypothetical protein|nr:hypothetical protein [Planctomycetota bacterium]
MEARTRKTGARWVFLRVYFIASTVGWFGAGAVCATLMQSGDPLFLIPFGTMLLCVPGVIMMFGLFVFRVPYCAFGPLRRTPWPPGPPALSRRGGRIGWWLRGSYTFHVWPEGIGFSAPLLGRGFARREEVRSVGRSGRLRRVEHASPEVRGALMVPAEAAEALARVLDAPAPPPTPAGTVRPFRPPRPERILYALAGGFAAVVYGVLVWTSLSAHSARGDIRGFVDGCGPEAVVVVDGMTLPRNRELLPLLRDLDRRLPSRGGGRLRLPARIIDGARRLDFELARVRSDPRCWLVYLPTGAATASNPIGSLRTEVLGPITTD